MQKELFPPTPEEVEEMNQTLAQYFMQIMDLEEEKKETTGGYTDKINSIKKKAESIRASLKMVK